MSNSEIDVDSLFAQTLTGDYEDDAPWEAVGALRRIGSREVLEKATSWCRSTDTLQRARGADILAQLGKTTEHPDNAFPEESYSAVSQLLKDEEEVQPTSSAIHALGHIGNASAIPEIAARASHSSARVRFAVACALGNFPNGPLSVKVLLQLTRDSDNDVRDWATFGIGDLGDQDTSEIRERLFELLRDSDEDVCEEALVGLCKRGDQRALPKLFFLLQQPAQSSRVTESAEMLLGIYPADEEWTADRYLDALRQRFDSA